MQAMVDFKLDAFISVIEELLRADEIERALWVCNNLPAFYRDNIPPEINTLRNEILKRICTPRDYIRFDNSTEYPAENLLMMKETLRGHMVIEELNWMKESNLRPHVIDFGPGDFWVPLLLNHYKFDFSYLPLPLSTQTQKLSEPYWNKPGREKKSESQPTVYLAFEIIEHLHSEQELKTEMLKSCGLADVIHVSTPKYTYDWSCKDWKEKADLGHLRAYTPTEFVSTLAKMFPEYYLSYYDHGIMHARLTLKNTGFKEIWERRELIERR